jgi:hypothetical protein
MPLASLVTPCLSCDHKQYPTFCKLAGIDPTDDYTGPDGIVHDIDGIDLWPILVSGGGESSPGRSWLPTTENSLLLDLRGAGNGSMFKLVTAEFKANRFYANGTQYMDTHLPCVGEEARWMGVQHIQSVQRVAPSVVGILEPRLNPAGVLVPKSCTVCSATSPCLFDVLEGAFTCFRLHALHSPEDCTHCTLLRTARTALS